MTNLPGLIGVVLAQTGKTLYQIDLFEANEALAPIRGS